MEIGNALLVSLDMTDLAAVGAFALGSSCLGAVGRGIACRGLEGALLLLAREAAFLVAVQTAEFIFEAVGEDSKLVYLVDEKG
jgi:hypothetical protein